MFEVQIIQIFFIAMGIAAIVALIYSAVQRYRNDQKAAGVTEDGGFWVSFEEWWHAGRPDFYPYRRMLCTELCAMGVKASLSERGRFEEKTGEGSLGIIDVANSPISWINVRLVGFGDDSQDFVDYGVKVPARPPPVVLESKTSSRHGAPAVVVWEGDDGGTGIVDRLTGDSSISDAIKGTCHVMVRSCPYYGCWLIVQRRYTWNSPLLKDYQWRCYERIAEIIQESTLQQPLTGARVDV